MNTEASAAYQICNGVYPATPAELANLASRITMIERFFVHLRHKEGFNASSPDLSSYDFERAASGKMTVKRWLEVRLGASYPQLDGMVVDQSGNILPHDALVAEARGTCEMRIELVLRFTARVTNKQSETQEQRLRELGKMLTGFPCIDRCEVSRPRILLRWHVV